MGGNLKQLELTAAYTLHKKPLWLEQQKQVPYTEHVCYTLTQSLTQNMFVTL